MKNKRLRIMYIFNERLFRIRMINFLLSGQHTAIKFEWTIECELKNTMKEFDHTYMNGIRKLQFLTLEWCSQSFPTFSYYFKIPGHFYWSIEMIPLKVIEINQNFIAESASFQVNNIFNWKLNKTLNTIWYGRPVGILFRS